MFPPTYATRGPSVGFTPPAAIYDQMRQIQASAFALDTNIEHYVSDDVFRRSWKAWYQAWFQLYSTYAGPDASTGAKLAVLLQTDDLAARVESYGEQLRSWYSDYSRQHQPNGQIVPGPSGQAPNLGLPSPSPSERGAAGFDLPWWVWSLFGASLVGGGYYAWHRFVAPRLK